MHSPRRVPATQVAGPRTAPVRPLPACLGRSAGDPPRPFACGIRAIRPTGFLLGAALLLGLSACSSHDLRARETTPAARSLLAAGILAANRGDDREAETLLRAATADSPFFVEAHRALQGLLDSRYRGHEAFEETRSLLKAHERRPEFLYLMGRVTADPEEQSALFRDCLEADPRGYWPNLAMGYALLQDRSFEGAEKHFRRALSARPGDARAWSFVAETRAASFRLEPALEAFREAARLDPADPLPALQCARILLVLGRREEAFETSFSLLGDPQAPAGAVREILRKTLRDEPAGARSLRALEAEFRSLTAFPGDPARLASAGTLAWKRGRPEIAVELLRKAVLGGAGAAAALDLRGAYFAAGRYLDGFRAWERKTPPSLWRVPGNEAAVRFDATREACEAASAAPEDPEALRTLGLALLSCGWVEEAGSVLSRAERLGSPDSKPLLDRARKHLEFVRRLRMFLHEEYGKHARSEGKEDLESLFAGIGAISREVLGEDLGRDNRVRDFFPIGEIVDPTAPAESSLLRYFAAFNQHLVLGRRRGLPPEAALMTVVIRDRAARGPDTGAETPFDLVAGEDFEIESLGEYLGGSLLGMALLRHLYVNLDTVFNREVRLRRDREAAERDRGRLVRFGAWRAESRQEALALDTGNGLSESLLLRDGASAEGEAPLRTAFEEVLRHERMHVRDAARFLPVSRHPLAALSLALRCGLSATEIEATLEERAALAALAASPRPYLALASLLEFAPYPESALPHSRGFCRLLGRILERILDNPELYPSVDRERNLCRQLHLLSAEEISGIARALAEEDGIDG